MSIKKSILVSAMIFVFTFGAFASINTNEVSRNISDMVRILDNSPYTTIQYSERDELKELAEKSLHLLREPVNHTEYRYAKWEETYTTDLKMTEMKVEISSGRKQRIEENFNNVYAIEVSVPKKWGLFHGNDPIFVESVKINYTNLRGRRESEDFFPHRWFEKKDDETYRLKEYAKDVTVVVTAACQDGKRKDCAIYINAKHVELKDSYANPYSSSVTDLKNFLDNIKFISRTDAQDILVRVLESVDPYSGSYTDAYADTELIDELKDINWLIEDNRLQIASDRLSRIIRSLRDEGYDLNVIRSLMEVKNLVDDGGYSAVLRAKDQLERAIENLSNTGSGSYTPGYGSVNVVDELKRIERELPNNIDRALRMARVLKRNLESTNGDERVINNLARVENLLETGNYADARQAKDLVSRVIGVLGGSSSSSSNGSSSYYNLRSELENVKRDLPYNTYSALSKMRTIKNRVASGNYGSTVERGVERVIMMLEKGGTQAGRDAETMIDRIISSL